MSLPRRVGATYRLQLGPACGFADAAARVGYLAALGIETVYLSPVAEAVPGSTHGYDGTDPTMLRSELGGAAGYGALVDACAAAGLGILVDWVPNHLATWPQGPWWRRLLAEGRNGAMGPVFDVDWEAGPPAGRGKVALPLLDRPLSEALACGAVTLGRRGEEHVVEVAGTDLPLSGGEVRDGEDVAEVLAAQHYRLVDWHDAADRNYRRFFDIDGLVGVRVEDPDVFDRTHAMVVALATAGRLSGIRVDHVDGLREPAAYLRRLADATGVPIAVEKILTGDEELRRDWPVIGTTGYEVLDDIGGALVDPGGLDRLSAAGRRDGDEPVDHLTVDTRDLVARTSFAGDLGRVARRLDVDEPALRATVVRLGRYRTYLEPVGTDGSDRSRAPDQAGEDAHVWRQAAGEDPERARVADAVCDPAKRDGALGLQQLTGAVMAKGVEDTAWYRLAGPLAFCEVGGDPGLDRADAVPRLVRRAGARAASGSAGLVPGTTHDTKRSEDVRCRLYSLSECPHEFEEGLARLRTSLGLGPTGGDLAAESRTVAQLVLGILPALPEGDHGDRRSTEPGDARWPGDEPMVERLGAALEKAAREAKLHSSWREPDEGYEGRLRSMAADVLGDGAALVRAAFGSVADDVARLGAVNSLSSVVLRHIVPGIPDCYQGGEVWDLSLVDPDNRRPVDTGPLEAALAALDAAATGATEAAAQTRRAWRDGTVKLLVTSRCLRARREAPGAFAPQTPVQALTASGPAAASVLGIARHAPGGPRGPGGEWVVGVVSRLAGALAAQAGDLPAGASYAGTTLELGPGAPPGWRDALSGRRIGAGDGRLALDEVLAVLPVALLIAEREAPG